MSLLTPVVSIEEGTKKESRQKSKQNKQNKLEEIPKKRGRPKKIKTEVEDGEEEWNVKKKKERKKPQSKAKGSKFQEIPLIPIATLKQKLKEISKQYKDGNIDKKSVNSESLLNVEIKQEFDIKPEFVEVLEELEDEDNREFDCPICKDDKLRKLKELKQHYKDEHKGKRLRTSKYSMDLHPCDVCGKEFKTAAGVKDHYETHNMYFQCVICKSSYKKLLDYVIHLRTHSEEGKFRCLVCDYSTEDIKMIADHVNGSHIDSTDSYKYWCEPCKKGFHLKTWYEEHENFHTGLKPFDCDLCGKSFMFSRYLDAHKSSIHKEETDLPNIHVCVICKKEYQHRNSLKLHMNSHTGNYSVCDICGKILSSKEKLKFHLRTHTGYKPFSCSYCGKCFTKKPILVEHVRIHTGERPYVCEYCQKAFSQRSSLVIHIRSHTGERPYVCEICNKGFVAKAMLNIHLKSCKGIIFNGSE